MSSTASTPLPSPLNPRLGAAAVLLGTIAVPFDSALNVAFPAIVSAFALDLPDIQWIVIAYTLTYAALMLVFGRAGDLIGHQRIFMLGAAVTVVAFSACAFATTYEWLLVARVVQGIGAALTLSCGPALLTSLYPESQRARILGLYTLIFGIGGACGPILAGLLVARWGWPAVFLFRAPFALLALGLAVKLPQDARTESIRQTFDIAGAVLLVASIATLLLALNGLQYFSHAGYGVGLFVVVLLMAAGFIRHELRTRHPILDLRYFKDLDFALLNGAHWLLNLSCFAVLLLVPFYLSRVEGLSTPLAGLLLAASPLGVALAGPLAPRLQRWSPHRLALAGAAAAAIAQLLIGAAAPLYDVGLIAAASLLQGLGAGLFQIAYLDFATALLPRKDRGVAGSLVMMTRTLGLVTGATLLMIAFRRLTESGAAPGLPDSAAFTHGFAGTFYVAGALSALIVIAGLARGWHRQGSL